MTTRSDQNTRLTVHVKSALRTLVPRFLERRQQDVSALNAALQSADFATIQSVGHRMRGNGASLGFESITRLGAAIEEAARDAKASAIRMLTAELQTYLDRVDVVFD